MKKLFIIAVLILISCGPATRTIMDSGEGIYSRVFDTQKSKADNYNASLEWITKYYENPLLVTKRADKENGVIVVKGTNNLTVGLTKLPFNHMVTIRSKDNAVLIEYEQTSNNSGYYPPSESMEESEKFFQVLSYSIVDFISRYETF